MYSRLTGQKVGRNSNRYKPMHEKVREVRWDLGGAMFSGLHRGTAFLLLRLSQVTAGKLAASPTLKREVGAAV